MATRFPGYAAASRQKTLKRAIPCRGVGLHSGTQITMRLCPAPINHGIVFHRTDIQDRNPFIAARYDNVVDTRLCTVIANEDDVRVGTVEHLMAAFAGCEIDNALVEIDGSEVAIMDGSSEPFVFLIDCAGIAEQDAPRRAIEIRKPVTVDMDGKRVTLSPADSYAIDFEIDFDSKAIGHASLGVEMVNGTFRHEIAQARTFGFLHEVEYLQANGLARGGSLDNAVVIDGDTVLNEGGLRFKDEFVRHKVLDCVGDLYLAGAPLIGHVDAVKAGHQINNAALRALFADPSAYAIVDVDDVYADDLLPATA
ncbi:UDP-3-O-acyl-N-acetylglucosamine deacetylase [Thalassobaculum sp. OXR-137]|uniref:UDP-3-O-acyl-N-acetylglucosamine deacetylase n=1 Tax=Thalassobaculum sp. OXR-137 TaxID=3100173 RepID=UPI002AC897E5|nr:UDP-3-O-acyl-N-acetylglucosamine deacetylase [Thalassobaculum sp. OXR-137]WPZ32152.1 UDP-3-O-acyl-N-acetylglucosamine deacetylase [Thalassobaculum sp. OXR-137]